MFNDNNPYLDASFHAQLLNYIFERFTKDEFMFVHDLYQMYNKILADYNRNNLSYDWKKKIDHFYNKYRKENPKKSF